MTREEKINKLRKYYAERGIFFADGILEDLACLPAINYPLKKEEEQNGISKT